VKELLYKHFWLPYGQDIETWPLRLAFKVFDFGVNASPSVAIKTLQKTVGAMPDGVIGSETRIKIMQSDPDTVIARFSLNQCQYYAQITTARPTYLEFLVGWVRRAADLGETI
jgi:lysozyme family protein